ncbi:cyclodeaminase/cyclohydrolase family protein [Microbacterium sp. 179-B 1A2 NHS]|uniref:cyclodeaminase/cyclohydrolase family protein n=1 Tax=Microbacterium sp. 179-B 1A2 NHS TaxID=3142383 RepID=UPI0039A28878
MEPEERASVTVPLEEWLDRLAQRGGAPGGGSASGVLLGVGAALLSMVLSYGDRSPALRDRAERLRADALADAIGDATASAALGGALAQPADDPGRDGQVRDAAAGGARSSAQLGATGVALVELLEETAEDTAAGLIADLGVAAEAIAAGLGGALINLRGDVDLIERRGGDAPAEIAAAADRMDAARRRAASHATRVREG